MSQCSWPLLLSASLSPLTLKSLELRTCFSIPWIISSVHDHECDLSYFVWQIFMWLDFTWGLIVLYIDASLVIEMRLTPLLFFFLLTNNHCNLQRNNIGNFFTSGKTNSHGTDFYFPILLFNVFVQLPFLTPFSFICLSFSTSPSFLCFFPNSSCLSSTIRVVSCFFSLPHCFPPLYKEFTVCSYSPEMENRGCEYETTTGVAGWREIPRSLRLHLQVEGFFPLTLLCHSDGFLLSNHRNDQQ